MKPRTIYKWLMFFALPLFGAALAWTKNLQLYTSKDVPLIANSVITVYKVRDTGEYMFVLANKNIPYKYLFGHTLYTGTCSNSSPYISWGDGNEFYIYCGSTKSINKNVNQINVFIK